MGCHGPTTGNGGGQVNHIGLRRLIRKHDEKPIFNNNDWSG